jgi:hypothetical protein
LTTLEDRFERYETPVHITGIQAIARVIIEQQRRDRARGLDTAGFVSGYPGSPLGGVDIVCGYEQLKLDSAAQFQGRLAALVPPRAAAAGGQLGPVRNRHDGQE